MKQSGEALLSEVRKEMAQPRAAASTRSEVSGASYSWLVVARVQKIHLDHLRIENSLTDQHGDDVKLKKGAHAEVTVTAESNNRR